MGRCIGLDVHRNFAQVAVLERGSCRDGGRIGVTPEALRESAQTLTPDDEVALEATGNSDAIAMLLAPLVKRVVVANPRKTRAIAEAKVKTDKVDARILAQLLAADFLPAAWLPDDQTRMLRRQIARRTHLVRQRTRLKNQVHAILARNLVPSCPATDLFGKTGRGWLGQQNLPPDERRSVDALVRQLDFHGEELAAVDAELVIEAVDDPVVARLMTIPGVDAIVAMSVVAAVGDFSRFTSADKLVSYIGLNPKVRQSGDTPASHGRISKAGRSQARGDAGRGRLGRCPSAGPVAGVLSSDQPSSRIPGGGGGHCPQADRLVLASCHQRRGLCLLPSQPQRSQAPQAGTRRRISPSSRPTRRRLPLQRQGAPPARTRACRTRRTCLPGDGGSLAAEKNRGLTITSVV